MPADSRLPGGAEPPRRTSLAIDNLRAIVVLLVLAFHSVLAYLNFLPAGTAPFDAPPFFWRAIPIIDHARWFGFDLFCAWLDVYLMTLFFFLSGLFVWPSLTRKGVVRFLRDRVLRLAVPFALVVGLLMPAALYPAYLERAALPGVAAYWRDWLALPFWPCGPMWFLWLLLVFDLAAAALHRVLPVLPVRLSGVAVRHPLRFLAALVLFSACAYVPLALLFGPSRWGALGPFALQLSRPLHYAVYFFAGAAIGAGGIERSLLAQGALARCWRGWLMAALALFLLWIAATAPTMPHPDAAPRGLQFVAALCFVAACFGSCLAVPTAAVRLAARHLPRLDSVRSNAYGMYLVHYLFVVWLQYGLLGAPLPAIVKGMTVFAATVVLSWGAVAGLRRLPAAAQIIGAGRVSGGAAG